MAQTPQKRAEYIAFAGAALSLVFAIIMFLTASAGSSGGALAEAFHLLAAVVVWGIAGLHQRQRRLAAEEAQELDEMERMRAGEGRSRLFDEGDLDAAVARRRLREMETYGAPIASAVIILVQAVTAAWFFYALAVVDDAPGVAGIFGMSESVELTDTALGAVVCFFVAFFCFAVGKYAAGMSFDERYRLLRAGAGYMLGNAGCAVLLMVSFALGYRGWFLGEAALRWIIPAFMALVAFEMFVNLVLDFYRPRVPGEQSRPVYDSRVTGLLAEPQGLFRTFSQTLDYQFGFRISETWFFRFLERAVAPLIIFQLGIFYLLTCIVIVDPGEVAVIETWGNPRGVETLPEFDDDPAWDALDGLVKPGIHVKWPWPIETVRTVPLQKVQLVRIGKPQEGEEITVDPIGVDPMMMDMQQDMHDLPAITWETPHIKDEFRYIMPLSSSIGASRMDRSAPGDDGEDRKVPDAMFISGAMDIQYVVGRPGPDGEPRSGDVYRYLYRYADPTAMMVAVSENAVLSYMAGSDFWDVMVEDLVEVERELRDRIQQAADDAGLGIHVQFVGVSNFHPPAGEVGGAYQDVVKAQIEKRTLIHKAQAEVAGILQLAPAEATELTAGALGYSHATVSTAKADAVRFRASMYANTAAPEVYTMRELLAALRQGLNETRVVVAPPGVTVVIDEKQALTPMAVSKALVEETSKE